MMKQQPVVIKSKDKGPIIGILVLIPIIGLLFYFILYMRETEKLLDYWMILVVMVFALAIIVLLICSVTKKVIICGDDIEVYYAPFIVKKEVTKYIYDKNSYKTLKGKIVPTETIAVKSGIFTAFFNSVDTQNFKTLFKYMVNSDISIITDDEDYILEFRSRNKNM